MVIGSGLAGLAASRVLADLFDEVLLLERDTLQPNQALHQAAMYLCSCVVGLLQMFEQGVRRGRVPNEVKITPACRMVK